MLSSSSLDPLPLRGKTALVTGVSRYLGGRYARLLSGDPAVDRVIGVDVVPPAHDIGRAEFVRADIRNPIIAKVIDRAEVDTVVHMNVIATPLGAGGRTVLVRVDDELAGRAQSAVRD